ncbi:hypothetical protein F5Y01DRAFT_310804 [Xylaria sp. FL0043]|nr:hypothetical protein F5Y01DRAFT_310804 [Xylaria sp. FL0043]
MPAPQEPQQQAPMEMTSDSAPGVVTQQPAAEPQPDMSLRGGEEAGCEEGGQRSSPIPIPSPRRPSIIEDRPNEFSFPSNIPVLGSNPRSGNNSGASNFTERFDVDEESTSAAGGKSSGKGKGKGKAKGHPLLRIRWADMDIQGKGKDKQRYKENNSAVYDEDDEAVYDEDDEEGDKGKGRAEGEGKVVTGSGSFIIKPPSFEGIRRSSKRYTFFEDLSPILESHDEE